MRQRFIVRVIIILTAGISSLYTGVVYSQNGFETALAKKIDSISFSGEEKKQLYPNDALNGMMVPSGWGGYGTYLFGFIGGAYPEVYTEHKVDLIAAGGFCIGDPEKLVNFAAALNMVDVHRFRDFSADFSLSRALGKGSSISAGGIHLFAGKESDAPRPSFYVAFSHAVQTIPSKTPYCSKLTYTIGVGNGRFLLKSPKDSAAGKGKYGTAVFAGISYEIIRHINLNAEWSGMNLGFSLGITPFKSPLSFGIGVTNLTSYSADKPTGLFSIGYPLSLNRNKL